MNEAKLGAFLVKLGIITPEQLHLATTAQNQGREVAGRLTNQLVTLGFVSEEELGRLAAMALRLAYVPLERVQIPPALVKLFSRDQARRARGMIVKNEGKRFWLATCDPTNMQMLDELQFQLGGRVIPVVAAETDVVRAIGHYYTTSVLVGRPYDLPFTDKLDLDSPEVFDIQAARRKRAEVQAAAGGQRKPDARAAAMDKLAAAASQVQSEAPAPPPRPRPERPVGASVAPPVEPDEVLILDDEGDETIEIGTPVEEVPLVLDAEPAPPPAAPAAEAGDFMAALSAAFGAGPSTTPAPAATGADADLAGLFMSMLDGAGAGASGESEAPGEAAPASPEDAAKELAALLLNNF